MIFGLFRSSPADSTFALYAAIVTEARHSAFYLHYGVPDTVTARFDMIVLHLALVVRRLRTDPAVDVPLPPERRGKAKTPTQLIQELVDMFFTEMDRSLREMGIGDVAIPKRIKKLIAAWNGRSRAYDGALEAADADELAAAIARNVLTTAADKSGALPLAHHVLATAAALATQPLDRLIAGQIVWPDPMLLAPGISP